MPFPTRRPSGSPGVARTPLWRRPVAVAVIAIVAFDVAALGGLAVAGLRLLPEPEPPAPAPAPDPTPAPPVPQPPSTAADRVLDGVVGLAPEQLFGAAEEVRDPVAEAYGSPFTRGCDPLPTAAAPLVARTRQARLAGSTGVTLQLWAYGAGQGPAALDALEGSLDDCARVAVRTPEEGAGVDRLVATSRGGDGTTWLVARRGDVLAAVGAADPGGSPPTAAAQEVAGRVDALLAERMAGVCAVQDAGLADAARSPYSVLPYEPFARSVPVRAPEVPLQPLPPPVDPPSVSRPSPRAFPDLAPYLGGRDPANPEALPPRGSAPVLVDPDDIRAPSPLVRRRPSEPSRPEQPREVVARLPEPDPAGPGCGWRFTGQQPPAFDEAALAAAAEQALDAARVELAAATARWQEEEEQFLADYAQYQADLAAYTAYRRYAALVDDAQTALARARRAAQPPPPLPSPTPSPSPSPSPSLEPEPEPDADPGARPSRPASPRPSPRPPGQR